jgi:hypothetical protein
MKILFLDVDGVLNDEQFCKKITAELDAQIGEVIIAQHISDVTDKFNPACVLELARIVQETGCNIVVTSAWRLTGIKVGSPFTNALVKSGDKETVRTIRKAIIGKTADLVLFGKNREDEIKQWLEDNPGVDMWVAVDDMPLNLDGNSVRTSDEHGGLTKEKADEVIQKLNDGEHVSYNEID